MAHDAAGDVWPGQATRCGEAGGGDGAISAATALTSKLRATLERGGGGVVRGQDAALSITTSGFYGLLQLKTFVLFLASDNRSKRPGVASRPGEFFNFTSNPRDMLSSRSTRWIKYGALILMVAQNSAFVLVMRFSRKQQDVSNASHGATYNISMVVTLQELFKLILCFAILAAQHRSIHTALSPLRKPKELVRISVPAACFTLQVPLPTRPL
eukprot:6182170-Pleurochrysis_carterae.AAC.1